MTKKYSTKRALIASILALCICFTMLVGTTFAWFTDSVTSGGNIIQTGKLDVAMYWVEGDEDPFAVTTWNEASGAIFKNDKWEPGYSEAKHIMIANEGTLALKYQMRIIASGVVSELATVIDVYYFADAKQLDRADFVEANRLGTLAEVLNVSFANNISNAISGSLEAGATKTVTLAFKMQESAGNEYQNLSIGSEFSIQLLATQYTSEEDSFDSNYDADADFAPQQIPAANVFKFSAEKAAGISMGTMSGANYIPNGVIGLDAAYSFQPTETFEQASASDYQWSHVDFYVYADATVPANSLMLAGYYELFGMFLGIDNTQWIGMSSDVDIEAGVGVRLLLDGMGLPGVSYSEICEYGNNGEGFLCGAVDLTGQNEGTTLYVELRAYKVGACGNTSEGHHHSNDVNCETGEYEVIGKFQHTFDNPNMERLDDGAVVEYTTDGEIILVDAFAVESATYYIPDGVTLIDDFAFKGNTAVTEVIVSDSVTSLGRAFDSNTAIKKVVLNEGLETIDSRAFKATTALEEVVIPSTVTTIANDAFQKTGLKTIVIPASVQYVGETAFGASKIETVIFEGSTTIENKAFRGATALKSVYYYGDEVTFTNASGHAPCYFCTSESLNANTTKIDFYFENTAVAAQFKAVMSNYGTYHVNNAEVSIKNVKNTAELQNALANSKAGDFICLMAGVTYDEIAIPASIADNVTVVGATGAVVKGMSCDALNFTPESNALKGFTLKNVAFEGKGFYMVNLSNKAPWCFVEDFTMDGCSFKGADQADVLGNRLFDLGTDSPSSHQFINLKITNCTVDTAIQGIRVGSLRGECEISGNVISNVAHNAITIRSVQAGTVLVEGNFMTNGGDRALRVGANSATINYVNNTIVNCGDAVDGTNFKANTLGSVTFTGNTVDGAAWNPLV